jgi:hypothetical protein
LKSSSFFIVVIGRIFHFVSSRVHFSSRSDLPLDHVKISFRGNTPTRSVSSIVALVVLDHGILEKELSTGSLPLSQGGCMSKTVFMTSVRSGYDSSPRLRIIGLFFVVHLALENHGHAGDDRWDREEWRREEVDGA